jgi:hypothetical protein
MDPNGRRISIFRNAANVYVWLSHLANDTCSEALPLIERVGSAQYFRDANNLEERELLLYYLEESINIIYLDS